MTASERFLPVWRIIQRAAVRAWGFVMRYRAYFLSFLIPPAVLFLSYIFFEVWPFGTRSVLSLDLNAQYVYYYDYMYDVFAGSESIFYSWSRNLSGEFMGIIGYYLASPFNLLVWMFPREWITEGLMVMMLAKAGAAGLSTAYFLKGHRGCSDTVTVMFAVMFALCGFFVVQTMNPMWLDGIVALPLVAAGVERICDKRRFKLYTLSLLYIFVANFYIGYMTGIFSALYFLYYLASGKGSCRRFGEYCGAVLMYAAASVTAILLSCFMIFPVYKSLSNGKLEFTTPDYSLAENFDIGNTFIRLFPTTYDTVRMEGMPILYCGTLALIGAVIYFVTRRFSVRERIAGGVFTGVMMLFMYIRPLDMLWHGGQMPNWLPYRYSFMVSFLLISFGAQAFDNITRVRGKAFGTAFIASLAMLLFADLNNGSEFYDQVLTVAIPLAVLTVIVIMAYVFGKYRERRVMCAVMTAAVCAECLLNTSVSLYQMHDDIVFSTRASYRWDIPYTREITEQVHELDNGFYRMEKTYHRCVNDPIALRMYGLSHSSSTLNAKAIALLKELGFTSREHYTRYDGATMLTDDIFGVKYVLAANASTQPYTDKLEGIKSGNGASVYINNDAFGLAYLAKKDVIGYKVSDMSPFLSQNSVAAMLSGNKSDTVFRSVGEVEFDSENIRSGSTTDAHYSYRKKDEDSDAWIAYTITAQADGPVYMYLPTKYEREVGLYINGEYAGTYFLYENHSIEYLGTYKEGEQFEVKLKLLEDVVYFTSAQFYYINMPSLERFQNSMSRLNSETELKRTGGATLEMSVNAPEDCALFTTIPAEEGWTVLVDGEPVEWETALNDTLLCVPLTKGEHTVVLDFFPAGMKLGLMFTACGALSFLIMVLALKRMRAAEAGRAPAENGETE